jgi:pilus assembly protein TadC
MTVAALALAVAVLIGAGPLSVRRRVRATPLHKPSPPPHELSTAADPLAGAAALDIFAVCLATGMAVPPAARAAARCAPPALATTLRRAADLLVLGAEPAKAWAADPNPGRDDQERALVRLAGRSAMSGTALAESVTELAEASRQDARHAAAAAAERAAVVIAGPLGLCFLPAFICLGVVPVVAGLATEVFGSGPL